MNRGSLQHYGLNSPANARCAMGIAPEVVGELFAFAGSAKWLS